MSDTLLLLLLNNREQAARRALGIVNRLQPGTYKGRHAGRVLSNMNRLRGARRRLLRDLLRPYTPTEV